MSKHNLNTFQIQGVSDDQFKDLIERMGHYGLTVTTSGEDHYVTGHELSGTLCHTSASQTVTVELDQVPPIVTPGHIVGRFYDEILHLEQGN